MAAPEGSMDEVVAWERREILRIAARDLTGRDGVEATTGLLADVARDVLVAAHGAAGADLGDGDHLVVGGMGKLGGDDRDRRRASQNSSHSSACRLRCSV